MKFLKECLCFIGIHAWKYRGSAIIRGDGYMWEIVSCTRCGKEKSGKRMEGIPSREELRKRNPDVQRAVIRGIRYDRKP